MTDKDEQEPNSDDQTQTYCRRLGHRVALAYCAAESDGRPCRLIRDCWFEQMDVDAWLAERFGRATVEELAGKKPPDKLGNLLEMIERAKRKDEG